MTRLTLQMRSSASTAPRKPFTWQGVDEVTSTRLREGLRPALGICGARLIRQSFTTQICLGEEHALVRFCQTHAKRFYPCCQCTCARMQLQRYGTNYMRSGGSGQKGCHRPHPKQCPSFKASSCRSCSPRATLPRRSRPGRVETSSS